MTQFRVFGSVLAGVIALSLTAASISQSAARQNSRNDADRSDLAEPMKIVVSIKKQRLYVYRGARLVTSSKVSTGKSGHQTPTGVFSILQKRRWHRSNIYSNAPMPYMQRLTWSGIALHEGHVPNYPASHGCIRLPRSVARQLFSMTDIGSHVIVADDEASPTPIMHPALFQPKPLGLITMDGREGWENWTKKTRSSTRYIPLPVRATVAGQEPSVKAPTVKPETEAVHKLSPREASLRVADFEHDLEQLKFYAEKNSEPLRILITRREGPEQIRDAQKLLIKLGEDPGPVDGYLGRQTRDAIRSFEEAEGMSLTGDVSGELMDALYLSVKEKPAPTGHIYVKQGFKTIFDAPIEITDARQPLGTHIFTALDFEPWDARTKWLGMTTEPGEGATANKTLDRIQLSDDVRARLERLLTPGSSLIISDGGLSAETSDHTDFVVLTN